MNSIQTNLPSQKLLAILAIPMLIALGISGYLTYASITASEIAGCGGGSIFDCGHVLHSKWSKFAGIPVSGLALMTYIGMLAASAVAFNQSFSTRTRELAWNGVTAMAVAASFAAVYFIFLQVVVLQHLCWYCLVCSYLWHRDCRNGTIPTSNPDDASHRIFLGSRLLHGGFDHRPSQLGRTTKIQDRDLSAGAGSSQHSNQYIKRRRNSH